MPVLHQCRGINTCFCARYELMSPWMTPNSHSVSNSTQQQKRQLTLALRPFHVIYFCWILVLERFATADMSPVKVTPCHTQWPACNSSGVPYYVYSLSFLRYNLQRLVENYKFFTRTHILNLSLQLRVTRVEFRHDVWCVKTRITGLPWLKIMIR